MNINTLNIKHLMIERNLKQKDVAARLGMHPTAFSFSLNNGKTTRDVAERLAVIFSVPLSEIVLSDSDIILPDLMDKDTLSKLESIIDKIIEARMHPLYEQMAVLNGLIVVLTKTINAGSG